jgi:hypothetical protein
MYTHICKNCNKSFLEPHKQTKFCSHLCYSSSNKSKNNHNWRGGKYKSVYGYIYIRAPKEHPFKAANGYIFEHRLIMEQKIGRYLRKEEIVHHINGIKNDNRIENLIITTRAIHNRIHAPKTICKIKDCNRKHKGLGYCNMHYQQIKKLS